MLEKKLKDLWTNSAQTEQIVVEMDELAKELRNKVNTLQKKIRIRDSREIAASVIGILFFGYLLFEIPFPVTKLACILSIIWFAFVIKKSLKSRKQNASIPLYLSIKEQLDVQEKAMTQQRKFLNTSAYWYSIPSFITNFLFIIGLGNPVDFNWSNSLLEKLLPLSLNMKLITLLGLALFYAFTIWINKKAVSADINPVLNNLILLKTQLKKE